MEEKGVLAGSEHLYGKFYPSIMLEQKILTLISSEYNNGKPVSATDSLAETLAMDSLDMFALKIELVVTFKIFISEEEMYGFITAADVIGCVSAKLKEKQKAKNKRFPSP